jgi:hypothetical protein
MTPRAAAKIAANATSTTLSVAPSTLSRSAVRQLGLPVKLRASSPTDAYEQEADRVADQIVTGGVVPAPLAGTITSLQRQPAEEEEDEREMLQTKRAALQRQTAATEDTGNNEKGENQDEDDDQALQLKAIYGPGTVKAVQTAAAAVAVGGQALSHTERAFFEPRFGYDLSAIRLHTDATAARAATTIGARAYTLRNHIAFAPGEYATGAAEGRRLLAHELTHTLQQDAPGTIRRQEDSGGIQVEQPAPAQTNTCGCEPPPTTLCTGNKQNMVLAAFNQAARWLPNAQQHVGNYQNAPANRRSSMPAAAPLRDHFRWPAGPNGPLRPTPDVVARVINNTLSNIEQPICANCQEECPCTGQGVDVFACSPGVWHGSNCYEFCQPFFESPDDSAADTRRAKIALHEMMHSWERMGDAAYEGDSNYSPNAQVAQTNADSFANLIRDLGS